MAIYQVNDIYPTIQGEGVLAGVPMVLIRLQGCAVGCAFCDTKETWEISGKNKTKFRDALGTNERWADASDVDIVNYCHAVACGERWALLTGGEPCQQEIGPLVKRLQSVGFKVALETSGTAPIDALASACLDWVCVSPKIDQPGGKRVYSQVIGRANEIKFVVGKKSDVETLKDNLKKWKEKLKSWNDATEILLQPMSMNEKATQICMDAATKHGWRISIQTHKVLAIR